MCEQQIDANLTGSMRSDSRVASTQITGDLGFRNLSFLSPTRALFVVTFYTYLFGIESERRTREANFRKCLLRPY